MSDRIPVLKTYKLYIGGAFPRTESGRYYVVENAKGKPLANMCRASRKDVRDAVVKARGALAGWSGKTAYNRSQILYRIAEMLEGRSAQFVEELMLHGLSRKKAEAEVTLSVDRLVYFAGWADKYTQVFSAVNPVASAHFNFSVPEPTGVVAIVAPEESPLLGLISVVSPVIVGGNTAVVLASTGKPLPAITLAEVLHTSDLPGGVVNLLTGYREELVSPLATHMDVNAIWYAAEDVAYRGMVQTEAANNLKRISFEGAKDWTSDALENPYLILDFQEIKTTWHPVESSSTGGGKY